LGIIQQQALRSTIANYIGVGLGAGSRLTLAIFVSDTAMGVIDLLDVITRIFSIIFDFGYNQVLLRIFPKYRDEEGGHAGFFLFGVFISIFGAILGLAVYFLLFDYLSPRDPLTGGYLYLKIFTFLLPFVIIFRILYKNLDGYARILFASVLGTVLESVVMKGVILAGVLLTFANILVFKDLLYVYIIALSLPGLLVSFYALYKTKKIILPRKDIFRDNKKQLPSLMLFGVLLGASSMIIMSIDKIMINNMIGTDAVGVYGQMFFAAILVSMTSRGVKRISSTALTEAWNANDRENIDQIYKRSCLNQMIIAFFILIVGWACIEPATDLLGKYQEGIYVFLFLGLGQLFEMMTGVNAEIIGTSKYYRFNTYFNLTLAVLVIVLNFIFINLWNITGAALASFIAIVLVNSIRWFFLYKRLGFQPFNLSFMKAMIPGVLLMAGITLFDYEMRPSYKILINASVLTGLYWFLVIKLRLSADINGWLTKIRNKFGTMGG